MGPFARRGAPRTPPLDADFAETILRDLYEYRRKRSWLAWLLWGTLGIFGVHRFYLDRPVTGLLMFFTGGGGMLWWIVDAALLPSMVREHAREQQRRRESGLRPLELDFMPPLDPAVLSRPPEWTAHWHAGSRGRRALRFTGDLLVLLVSGVSLAAVARHADVWEAVVAVLVLVVVASAGGALGPLAHLPVFRALLRWSHRLRLFYYFNGPGSPPALLVRSVTATITAPFRSRDRAEVRLYLQLGAAFTVTFVLLDVGGELIDLLTGGGMPSIIDLLVVWLNDAVLTFVVIFAFATPIGAVITRYLLVMRTHTVPRLLSGMVAATVVLGLAAL